MVGVMCSVPASVVYAAGRSRAAFARAWVGLSQLKKLSDMMIVSLGCIRHCLPATFA